MLQGKTNQVTQLATFMWLVITRQPPDLSLDLLAQCPFYAGSSAIHQGGQPAPWVGAGEGKGMRKW